MVAAAGGLLLALLGGPGLVLVASLVLAIGVAYDLRAKGTTLSWLPFAVGIPLLPVYGWYGATGSLPGVFLVLVPAAANAGTALAIANAIVDMERDEAAGIGSIALALGARRASAWWSGSRGSWRSSRSGPRRCSGHRRAGRWPSCSPPRPARGRVLGLAPHRGGGPGWRELAWEIQAVGTGLLAVAWLAALSASAGWEHADTEAADTGDAHGALVSAAQMVTPAGFRNHGAFVSWSPT